MKNQLAKHINSNKFSFMRFVIVFQLGLSTSSLAKSVSQFESGCHKFYISKSSQFRGKNKSKSVLDPSLELLEQKSFFAKDYKAGDDVDGKVVIDRLDKLEKKLRQRQSSDNLAEDRKTGVSIVRSLLKFVVNSKNEKTFLNKNDIEGLDDFILKYLDVLEGKNKESILSFNELGYTVINEFNLNKGNPNIYEAFSRSFEVLYGKEESVVRQARLRLCK